MPLPLTTDDIKNATEEDFLALEKIASAANSRVAILRREIRQRQDADKDNPAQFVADMITDNIDRTSGTKAVIAQFKDRLPAEVQQAVIDSLRKREPHFNSEMLHRSFQEMVNHIDEQEAQEIETELSEIDRAQKRGRGRGAVEALASANRSGVRVNKSEAEWLDDYNDGKVPFDDLPAHVQRRLEG